jgi:sigma-B regulation protein RsbU (phosphoserine phosphatase)
MESLPPVTLGATIFTAFLLALIVRRPIERRWVLTASPFHQPKRQFTVELAIYLGIGIFAFLINRIIYGMPVPSGLMLLLGCLVIGFFLSLDLALFRERTVILSSSASALPPAQLYSVTRKFSLIATGATVSTGLIFFLVISRDLSWLSQLRGSDAIFRQARTSALSEIVFILAVSLALLLNLIFSYSKNLKILFDNQTRVLNRVSQGDLSRMVPVATEDEFGFIAGHTNHMIEGLRHRSRLVGDMKLAEELQQKLLPHRPPDFPGIDIAGLSVYCNETGGDYFDYFELPGGRLGVAVADASEHGIGAALHMTTTRAFLHSGVSHYPGPVELLKWVNRFLARDGMETGRFTTLFFLEIDLSEKVLCWVRAGHEAAILYDPSEGRFESLLSGGTALGVMEPVDLKAGRKDGWSPGTVVAIGTDGIHETQNEHGEMFGRDRLKTLIRLNANRSATAIQKAIYKALADFRGQTPQEDDTTLVVIRFD